jgi:hypothetical protein
MRLPRMSTRRWMKAVAVLGLSFGAVVFGDRFNQRRHYCLQQASMYARMENWLRPIDPSLVSVSCARLPPIVLNGHTYQADTVAAYYVQLKRIHLRVASRPWLSLPPEPANFAIHIRSRFPQPTVFERRARFPAQARDTRKGHTFNL